jgi:hypothetical protein
VLDERGGPNFPNGVPGGVSYPDGVQDKDGLIWITYDRDRNGRGEILLAKFREEDVIAGKDVSGAVSLKQVVNKLDKPANAPQPPPTALPAAIRPSPEWTVQAATDAKEDFSSIPFDGISPNKLACDTTLRELPDGSWVMIMPGGGDTEPRPENQNYPDGFVSNDTKWLHFAYDDNRHRAVHYSAKLPPLPAPQAAAAPAGSSARKPH